MENYRVLKRIGEGAFGEVSLCEDLRTGRHVAVKKVSVRRLEEGLTVSVWREVKGLELAAHPNVVQVSETFAHGSAVVIVMESMRGSLADAISERQTSFPEALVKTYMTGILRGLCHLHSMGIIHRDMKPGNVLIGDRGQVKLGDFGLARVLAKPEHGFSYQAATRWYRAPEMLYAARMYGTEVDMWGAGCIMAEMLTLSPMFPGETDIDQLNRIYSVCGTPDVWLHDWPEAASLADFGKISFTPMPAGRVEAVLLQHSRVAASLVAAMIRVPPPHRISASAALQHAWFVLADLPAPPSRLRVSAAPTPTASPLCRWVIHDDAWQTAVAAFGSKTSVSSRVLDE